MVKISAVLLALVVSSSAMTLDKAERGALNNGQNSQKCVLKSDCEHELSLSCKTFCAEHNLSYGTELKGCGSNRKRCCCV